MGKLRLRKLKSIAQVVERISSLSALWLFHCGGKKEQSYLATVRIYLRMLLPEISKGHTTVCLGFETEYVFIKKQ